MTTTPSPGEDVPRYFHDYALENERQHKELATGITDLRGELKAELHLMENRLLWRILGGVVVAVGLGTVLDRLLAG